LLGRKLAPASAPRLKEQKPQREGGACRGFCLQLTPVPSCDVELALELMTVRLAELVNVRTEPFSLRQLCVKSAEAFWRSASFAMRVGNCTQHSALRIHLAPWPRTPPAPHPREVTAAIYFLIFFKRSLARRNFLTIFSLRGGTNPALRFRVKRRTGDGNVSPRNYSVLPAVRRPLPRNRSEAVGSRGQNCAS